MHWTDALIPVFIAQMVQISLHVADKRNQERLIALQRETNSHLREAKYLLKAVLVSKDEETRG